MIIVFKNNSGKAVRSLTWSSDKVIAVQSKLTGRLHFVDSTEQFEAKDEPFAIIKELDKTQITPEGVAIGTIGSLALAADPVSIKDIEPSEEAEDRLPIYFKWTGLSYVALILLLMGGTWLFTQFFAKDEPVIVQVIQQQRKVETRQTVRASKTKVNRRKKIVKSSHRKVVAQGQTNRKNPKKIRNTRNARTNVNVEKIGALGALGGLGGFSRDSSGGGGLSAKAKSGSGYGYGGAAAKGGHERGLVGKGLATGGIGGDRNLKGYGGLGTKGMGGGQPGYGSRKIGGTSAGFFEPLSDETWVEGGLDRDQINAVILKNRGQITYCYERGLQQDPSLSGRVEVKFVINPVGRVSAANIAHTSLSARKVENCIVNRLRSWKFPTPVGNVNVRVTYPFLLQRMSKG